MDNITLLGAQPGGGGARSFLALRRPVNTPAKKSAGRNAGLVVQRGLDNLAHVCPPSRPATQPHTPVRGRGRCGDSNRVSWQRRPKVKALPASG